MSGRENLCSMTEETGPKPAAGGIVEDIEGRAKEARAEASLTEPAAHEAAVRARHR
jgi:hypothetical protein